MLQSPGVVLALFEVLLWFFVSKQIRNRFPNFMKMSGFTYYWFTFTILTGFWEIVYLTQYKYVTGTLAPQLVSTKSHVWTNKYDFMYVLPWKFSELFYSEYGAWADREYMSQKDLWSHFIEGSHCLFCSVFCLWTLIVAIISGINTKHFSVALAFAMGCQFMNSFLYMTEYGIQCKNPDSVNYYNTAGFPLGKYWIDRAFMYINWLWIICPVTITIFHLMNKQKSSSLSIQSDEIRYLKNTKIIHSTPV